MDTELSDLVELLRETDERIAGGFRRSKGEAVDALKSFIARQNTHTETLRDVKCALETLGEKDRAGIHPLDYVCCSDGVRNIGDRIDAAIAASATTAIRHGALSFQSEVVKTLTDVFGEPNLSSRNERAKRFLEEAVELVRVAGLTDEEVAAVVAYEMGRDVGPDLAQEIGGAGITLYALAESFAHSLEKSSRDELARVAANRDRCRAKHALKPDAVLSSPSPVVP